MGSVKLNAVGLTGSSAMFRIQQLCQPVWLAFYSAMAIVGVLCATGDPSWETNDDVGMSMVAHGYGIATTGSPKIIFSNVIWGFVVRALPSFLGLRGYSLGTLLVLVISAWAILYFLLRLGVGYWAAFLAVALVFTRPVIFPQFTINAGLLTVAALLGLRVYAKSGEAGTLLSICLLAFFAYLIRSQEFFLIVGIALPFLPWRVLGARRTGLIAIVAVGLLMGLAGKIDQLGYRGPAWESFHRLNSARAPYTDFRADEYIKAQPTLMANHGYSENDVNLVKNWFFVDPKIANPEALNAMVRELGPLPLQARSAATGLEGLQSLLIPELLPLLACAAILLLLKPTWRTALILLSGALAVFAMGAMGRPGVSRVYFPMVSLLLMASLLPLKALSRRWLVPGLLLATSVANAYPVVMQARASSNAIRQARLDVAKLPRESIVIWGEGFPFEAAFPLFEGTGIARAPRLYGLGVFTLAPLSVATLDERSGNGFITRLNGSKGIEVIASSQRVDLLRTYCMEHWGRRLIESEAHQFPSFAIRRVRCE